MPVRRWSFWMPAEDHGFYRRLISQYRSRLTPLGRGLLLAIVAGFAFSRAGAPTFLVSVIALGGLAGGWLAGLFYRPRIVVRRELGPAPSEGEVMRYRVRVRNTGEREIRDFNLHEGGFPFGLYTVPEDEGAAAVVHRLGPGEEAIVGLALRCGQRGAYELQPLRVGTSFPSGLIRLPQRAGGSRRLLVYPRFVPQRELELPVSRRYQPGGIAVSSDVGDSTEFLGTRDYREGDRLRDVHWPSYARSGRLVVKEYREEYFVRIGLVLDTELPRRHHPDAFEARVSLAAGIADALARRDYVIDLFAAGAQLHHIQAGRALARLDTVLQLLACVEPSPEVAFEKVESALALQGGRLSSIVLLLDDWDEARARLCRQLERAGTGVRPIVVRDRATSLALDPRAVQVPTSIRDGLLQ